MDDHKIKGQLSRLIKDPALEKLELTLEEPNFFYILGIEKLEIRHSNFLSWLLDPHENHGLGFLFLKRFLIDIFSEEEYDWINEFSVDGLDFKNFEIRREWNNIDILIIAETFVICIENKFYSADHSGQLRRYFEIINNSFKEKNQVFIYLTPAGNDPKEHVEGNYQNYSYERIAENLSNILELYSENLSPRIHNYLLDYFKLIKREIMKEAQANEMARNLYKNHKEAIDFIIENKPDRLADVQEIMVKAIKDCGYIPGTQHKGYARFLTPELNDVVPSTGSGWSLNEACLFEINYWPKTLVIKFVVSPGHDVNRDLLIETIEKMQGSGSPRGAKWRSYFSQSMSFNVANDKYSDDDIYEKITQLIQEYQQNIEKIEKEIIKISSQFE